MRGYSVNFISNILRRCPASGSDELQGVTNALERYFYRHLGEWIALSFIATFLFFVALLASLVVFYQADNGFQVALYLILSAVIALLLLGVMLVGGCSMAMQAQEFLQAQKDAAEVKQSRDIIREHEAALVRQEERIQQILARMHETEKECRTLREQMEAVLRSWSMRITAKRLKGGTILTEWEGE